MGTQVDVKQIKGLKEIFDTGLVHDYINVTGTAAVSSSPRWSARYDVTDPDVTSYTDGMKIAFVVPVAGHSDYGTALQINNLGYKPIVFGASSSIGGRYPVGGIIIARYNATQTASIYLGSGHQNETVTGCWQVMDYDNNTYLISKLIYERGTYISKKAAYRYTLMMQNLAGELIPLHSTAQSSSSYNASQATDKPMTTEPFNPFGIIALNYYPVRVADGETIPAVRLYRQYALSPKYTLNCGDTLANGPLYLVTELQPDGQVKLTTNGNPWTQSLPNSADGKIYIHIGHCASATMFELYPHHPAYWHDGSGIRLYTGCVMRHGSTDWTNPVMAPSAKAVKDLMDALPTPKDDTAWKLTYDGETTIPVGSTQQITQGSVLAFGTNDTFLNSFGYKDILFPVAVSGGNSIPQERISPFKDIMVYTGKGTGNKSFVNGQDLWRQERFNLKVTWMYAQLNQTVEIRKPVYLITDMPDSDGLVGITGVTQDMWSVTTTERLIILLAWMCDDGLAELLPHHPAFIWDGTGYRTYEDCGSNEVEVSTTEPTDPNVEVWINPNGDADRIKRINGIVVLRAIPLENARPGERYFFSKGVPTMKISSVLKNEILDGDASALNGYGMMNTNVNGTAFYRTNGNPNMPILVTIPPEEWLSGEYRNGSESNAWMLFKWLDDIASDNNGNTGAAPGWHEYAWRADGLTTRDLASPYFEITNGEVVCVKKIVTKRDDNGKIHIKGADLGKKGYGTRGGNQDFAFDIQDKQPGAGRNRRRGNGYGACHYRLRALGGKHILSIPVYRKGRLRRYVNIIYGMARGKRSVFSIKVQVVKGKKDRII